MQIWFLAATDRLPPKDFTRHLTKADGVKDTRESEGRAPVGSALTLYASIFGTGKALSQPLEGKKAYVQVIQP